MLGQIPISDSEFSEAETKVYGDALGFHSPHMFTELRTPLNCIIFGANEARMNSAAELIRETEQVEQIVHISTLANLRNNLASYPYDFVVVILDESDEQLPACILRYPELQVLVLTATRKVGPIDVWSKQGANDVVSSLRPRKQKHALNRIIEECKTRSVLRNMTRKLSAYNELQQILLDSRDEAILIWQYGQIQASNQLFDELINTDVKENTSRNIEWKRWLSALSFAELHGPSMTPEDGMMITNHRHQKFSTKVEILKLGAHKAQLIRIDPNPQIDNTHDDKKLDSTTGVLLPDAFCSAFDTWLNTTAEARYTIAQIHVDEPELAVSTGGANSTVRELISYRLAELLQKTFKDGTLIGRTGPTTLALLPLKNGRHTRGLARRIRKSLGTIGELVEDSDQICIKTLTLSPKTLRSSDVLERLEQPPMITSRRLPKDIPILTLRS